MVDKISYGSLELACFHEAGHAVTAIQVGATVTEIEIYHEPGQYYGRTRVDRTDEQALSIVLGGFAAEFRLFDAQRLLMETGEAPTEQEFIQRSMRNATEDRRRFISLRYGMTLSVDDDIPRAPDLLFIKFGLALAKDQLQFEAVERVANVLLPARKLDGAVIRGAFEG